MEHNGAQEVNLSIRAASYFGMQHSAQLELYLRDLDGNDSDAKHIITTSQHSSYRYFPISLQSFISDITRWIADGPLSIFISNLLYHIIESMHNVWVEEMVWLDLPARAPPPPPPIPASNYVVLSFILGTFLSLIFMPISCTSASIIAIVAILAVVLIPMLLAAYIKKQLQGIRADLTACVSQVRAAICVVRKLHLTSLGRQLSHPQPPLGRLSAASCDPNSSSEPSSNDSSNSHATQVQTHSTDLPWISNAKGLLHREVQRLQSDLEPWTRNRPNGAQSTLNPATDANAQPLQSNLVESVAIQTLEIAIPHLVRDLVDRSSVDQWADLYQTMATPLALRGIARAIGGYKRRMREICMALDADYSTDAPICPESINVAPTGIPGDYLELRRELLALRLRHETVLYRLYLAECALTDKSMLRLLMPAADAASREGTAAALDCLYEAKRLLGGYCKLGHPKDSSVVPCERDYQVDKELLLGLLAVVPGPVVYDRLCRSLSSLEFRLGVGAEIKEQVGCGRIDRELGERQIVRVDTESSMKSTDDQRAQCAKSFEDGEDRQQIGGQKGSDTINFRDEAVEIFTGFSCGPISAEPNSSLGVDEDGSVSMMNRALVSGIMYELQESLQALACRPEKLRGASDEKADLMGGCVAVYPQIAGHEVSTTATDMLLQRTAGDAKASMAFRAELSKQILFTGGRDEHVLGTDSDDDEA